VASPEEIACVGAIVVDDLGRLLLIRRRNPPSQGLWSLPGGRVEEGESSEAAVVRELLEETGISGAVEGFVGVVRREAPEGGVYVIRDYRVSRTGSSEPVAGDDALDVGWFHESDVRDLGTSPGLIDALTEWGILSR